MAQILIHFQVQFSIFAVDNDSSSLPPTGSVDSFLFLDRASASLHFRATRRLSDSPSTDGSTDWPTNGTTEAVVVDRQTKIVSIVGQRSPLFALAFLFAVADAGSSVVANARTTLVGAAANSPLFGTSFDEHSTAGGWERDVLGFVRRRDSLQLRQSSQTQIRAYDSRAIATGMYHVIDLSGFVSLRTHIEWLFD